MQIGARAVLLLLIGLIHGPNQVNAQYCNPTTACDSKFEFIRSGNVSINLPTFCYSFRVDDRTANDTLYFAPGEVNEVRAKVLKYVNAYAFAYVDWNGDETFDIDETYTLNGSYLDASGHVAAITPPDGVTSGSFRMRFQLISDVNYALYGPSACINGAYHYVDVIVKVTDTPPSGGGGGTYCPSQSTHFYCNYYYIRIADVQGDGAGIYRSSYCDKYYDGTNLSARWTTGNTYIVEITNSSTTTVNLQTYVYVDWNEDYDFSDPDEVFTIPANYGTMIIPVTVPPNVTSGDKRMRIITTVGPAPPIPCGGYTSGETEDYTINVVNANNPPPGCVGRSTYSPAHLSSNNCVNLDTVSWTGVANATAYEFKLKEFGQSTYLIEQKVTSPMAIIPDGTLKASKSYEIVAIAENDYGTAQNCLSARFSTSSDFGDIAIVPGTDLTLCQGNSIQLDATITPPKAGDTHAWEGPQGMLSATNIKNPLLTGISTGDFDLKFTLTNSVGCSKSVDVSLSVLESADGTNVKNDTADLCVGDVFNTLIIASNDNVFSNGTFTVEKFDAGSATWNATADQVIASQLQIVQNTVGSHLYRLRINLNGCVSYSQDIKINVHKVPDAPRIDHTGTLSFCRGEISELKVTNYTSGLLWNTGRVGATQALDQSGTYSVTYTSPVGCEAQSAEINVNIKERPARPNIEIVETPPFCIGETVHLTAVSKADFFWSNGSSNDTIMVDKNGTYGLTVTAPNACKNFATPVVISFNEVPPKPIVFEIKPTPLCEGDSVILIEQSGQNIIWSNGETKKQIVVKDGADYFVTTGDPGCSSKSDVYSYDFGAIPAKPEIALTPEGPYCQGDVVKAYSVNGERVKWFNNQISDTVLVNPARDVFALNVSENGCTNKSEAMNVVFNALPSKPQIYVSMDSLRVVDNSLPKYIWYRNDELMQHENNFYIQPNETGNFSVIAISEYDCSSKMSDKAFFVGIKELKNESVSLYPVPFSRELNVKLNRKAQRVSLLDIQGRSLKVQVDALPNYQYKITHDTPGYYIVKIEFDNGYVVRPVIAN